MKKISIIIPCYNVEKYIDYCLESLFNQTIGIEQLEIILVDDFSTDHTREILMRYESKFPENILVICNEQNIRQGACRNNALQYATGDFISFVDGDDWLDLRMYEILLAVMEQFPDADMVQFLHKNEEKEQRFCSDIIGDVKYYKYDSAEARKNMLLNSNILNESCTNKLYRRRVLFDENGDLRSYYGEGVVYEEPLFTYPLKFYVGATCKLDMPLYIYRHNQQGTINNIMVDTNRTYDHLAVQKTLFLKMRESEFYETYKTEIDFYFLHAFCVEPFFFLKYRNQEMPVDMLQTILAVTKEIFGCIPDNPYFKHESLQDEYKIIQLLQRI